MTTGGAEVNQNNWQGLIILAKEAGICLSA